MEVFGGGSHPVVIVDYAHTPDALAKLLDAARAHARGRLTCVFGCGGDRDAGKRPQMGAIAEELADAVVLTNDNPRTEDPGAILRAIAAGMRDPGRATVIPDRAEAIRHALAESEAGDVVVIAGKGHEDYQVVGHERRPFSDRDVVLEALAGRVVNRDLAALARVTGGALHGANVPFGRVVSDSRSVGAGELFVALRGEHYDAHDFVPDVASRGAAGALVNRLVSVHIAQVVVPDVLAGLASFARAWRGDFSGRIVGITGSNGKTTVKEMTGAILGRRGACLTTQGNLNNHIGVPLTLARLEATHGYGVIEMGANHPGEIAYLARLATPDVGLVINAGPAHLEGFGGLDGVAEAKGELFEALGKNATAVINADDRYRRPVARSRARGRPHDHLRHARGRGLPGLATGVAHRAGRVRDRVRARLPARQPPHRAQPGRRAQRDERARRRGRRAGRGRRPRRHRAGSRVHAAACRVACSSSPRAPGRG